MSIKTLLPMEHTFTVDVAGSETGQRFSGTFTYKRPNIRTKSEIDKMTARLNSDLKNLDEDTHFIHRVLAKLRYTLTPQTNAQWWIENDYGFELYDLNVILDIYKECTNFDNDWWEKMWGEEKKEVKDAEVKA